MRCLQQNQGFESLFEKDPQCDTDVQGSAWSCSAQLWMQCTSHLQLRKLEEERAQIINVENRNLSFLINFSLKEDR